MEILVQLFAFFRPVFFIDLSIEVGGLSLLQLAAIGFMGLLGACLLGHMGLRKGIVLTPLDVVILLYLGWAVVGLLAYPEKTDIGEFMKFTFPLTGYLILKSLITDEKQYRRVFFFMLIGFSVPILASAALTAVGRGVYEVNYWTKIPRFRGVFANPHNFGHSMAFFVMALVIFLHLTYQDKLANRFKLPGFWTVGLVGLVPFALFGLYSSYVRTTFIGLFIFIVVYLYYVNRRILVLGVFASGVLVVFFAPALALIFIDVVEVFGGERDIERIGSGRPYFWMHNLEEFGELSFDRKMVGAGIGNEVQMGEIVPGDSFWSSHNDFLDVMIQTGVVGLLLFLVIQAIFWWRVLMLPLIVRGPFVALMASVTFMNFVSNSYVSRFGVAQLFYLVLVFTESKLSQSYRIGTRRPEDATADPEDGRTVRKRNARVTRPGSVAGRTVPHPRFKAGN